MLKFTVGASTLFGLIGAILGLIAPWGPLSPLVEWLDFLPIPTIFIVGLLSIIFIVIGALILGGTVFAILSALFLTEEERLEASSKFIENVASIFID